MVVSAGRRLAPVALYIKRRHPHTFLLHLMSPGIAPRAFDLLALPEHDRAAPAPNLIRTLGAPHNVTPERLKDYGKSLAAYPSPRIGLLIGGDTAHGRWTQEELSAFLAQATNLAPSGSILATTSRRTPPWAYPFIETALQPHPHLLYRYDRPQGENPYHDILAASDMLIVTGESVSMCSEACATGKPVYLFTPGNAPSPKHRRFLAMLTQGGYARRLEDYDPAWCPAAALDEAGRLTHIITTSFMREPL
jgi:mitochondrial fission protein ELM1